MDKGKTLLCIAGIAFAIADIAIGQDLEQRQDVVQIDTVIVNDFERAYSVRGWFSNESGSFRRTEILLFTQMYHEGIPITRLQFGAGGKHVRAEITGTRFERGFRAQGWRADINTEQPFNRIYAVLVEISAPVPMQKVAKIVHDEVRIIEDVLHLISSSGMRPVAYTYYDL